MGTSHMAIYQAIVREHAPAFVNPLTWYINGKRGHLHAYANCAKLRRHGVLTISLGLRDAITDRIVCEECLSWGSLDNEQRETFTLARILIDASNRAEYNLGSIFPGRHAIAVARNHHFRKTLATSVRCETSLHGMENWLNRVVTGIEESIPDLPAEDMVNDDCVKAAAPRVLHRRFTSDELDLGFWGGSEVMRIAGGTTIVPAYRQNEVPLSFFTKVWLDKLSEGLTPQEATNLLLGNGELVNLLSVPDKAQLERCAVVLDMVAGESLWKFTERNWQTQILTALATAAAAMTLRYEQLIAPMQPVLIGNQTHGVSSLRSQVSGDNVENVIASLQDIIGNNERSVIICHPTVANFLRGRGHYGSWTDPISLTEIPEVDVLETVVALWDPRNRYSAYEKLDDALVAARSL